MCFIGHSHSVTISKSWGPRVHLCQNAKHFVKAALTYHAQKKRADVVTLTFDHQNPISPSLSPREWLCQTNFLTAISVYESNYICCGSIKVGNYSKCSYTTLHINVTCFESHWQSVWEFEHHCVSNWLIYSELITIGYTNWIIFHEHKKEYLFIMSTLV